MLVIALHMPPIGHRTGGVPRWDKPIHFTLYLGLAGLLAFAAKRSFWTQHTRAAQAVLIWGAVTAIVAVHGMVDELTQPWTGRDAEFLDWVADCAGAAVGAAMAVLVRRL